MVAKRLHIRGIVQGVGFRPFVFRLARDHGLAGWVLNGPDGVDVHVEGSESAVREFARDLEGRAPVAARIATVDVAPVPIAGCTDFEIRHSATRDCPTVRIAPDLSVCADCVRELKHPHDRRFGYPYINCTNCGPRYSILLSLPYDRDRTTMEPWAMCAGCRQEFEDPSDRRFHAQPIACPACGPGYGLTMAGCPDPARDSTSAIEQAARLLREGHVVAVKGIGGYHLACDARNVAAVASLRARKVRKEQPFAVMVADSAALSALIDASPELTAVAESVARPIALAPARLELPGVAPDNTDLGVMLPYAPLHHLLFAAGAPDALVMTSGNRSSEPIAFEDADASALLGDLADAMLIGDRPIARRVDDSVVRDGPFGPFVVRRSRGYAPAAVAHLPAGRPVLALGADLKNTVTLVVDDTAFVSQHIGDLEHYAARIAFDRTITDLLGMYCIRDEDLLVAYDSHPDSRSAARAATLGATHLAVQHHRAHVASVLAERDALSTRVIGLAFDGTGYGDEGAIWGGEVFAGSVRGELTRVAHLREARLPGGDAAARLPMQAAAGFLAGLGDLPDLTADPFRFTPQYTLARRIVDANIRTFVTTSAGRLFDTAAALLGFTRPVTFEGQAAIWLEHRARSNPSTWSLPFRYDSGILDYHNALRTIIDARLRGIDIGQIARAFHRGLADAIAVAIERLTDEHDPEAIVLSGGTFQNVVLLGDLKQGLSDYPRPVWTNQSVPPNDGGISLGQAAIAASADRG
jgi:hydrogenase maturation protein HypF